MRISLLVSGLVAITTLVPTDDADSRRRKRSSYSSSSSYRLPQRAIERAGGAFANCAAARAAGAAPVRRGSPGYSRRLDRDGDGVGCE